MLSAFEDSDDAPVDAGDDYEEDEDFVDEDEPAVDDGEEEDEDEGEDTQILAPPPRRTAAASKKAAPARTSTGRKAATGTATRKSPAKAAPARSTKKVIVVPGRDRYHTSGCRFVKGKDDTETVTLAAAKRGGYEPCSVCKPD